MARSLDPPRPQVRVFRAERSAPEEIWDSICQQVDAPRSLTYLLLLDFHGVADASPRCTQAILSRAQQLPQTAVAILTYTTSERFVAQAETFITNALAGTSGKVPIIVTPAKLGVEGKAAFISRLKAAAPRDCRPRIVHIDDRSEIIRDVKAAGHEGYLYDPRGRWSLSEHLEWYRLL